MKINLDDKFTSQELEFGEKCTYIFGKNGTGKTSITNMIKEQILDKDVRVFKNFEGLLGEDNRLNAVILGEENNEINKKIKELEAEIEKIKIEKNRLNQSVEKPNDGEENLYSKLENAQYEVSDIKKHINKTLSDNASKIKHMNNPQIAVPTYDKNNLKLDIGDNSKLDENTIKQLELILNSPIKTAINIEKINVDLEQLISSVNAILGKKIEEKTRIIRLDTNEKREFAKEGLKIHRKGDRCSFCDNIISDEAYIEIESYFSADEVKVLQENIDKNINTIKKLEEKIEKIKISETDFYPQYIDECTKIKNSIGEVKLEYINITKILLNRLNDKKSSLFSMTPSIEINIHKNIDEVINEYSKLVEVNNSNNLETEKEKAKTQLRRHYVNKYLDESNYKTLLIAKENLEKSLEEKQSEFNKIKDEINYYITEIESIQKSTKELEAQTKNEKILSENINKKLSSYVDFQLNHCEENGKGHYSILSLKTNTLRRITELSTGEKNIVAFLYFLEKINEIDETSAKDNKVIVFDDPMTSNDSAMQYLIIDEINKLKKICLLKILIR